MERPSSEFVRFGDVLKFLGETGTLASNFDSTGSLWVLPFTGSDDVESVEDCEDDLLGTINLLFPLNSLASSFSILSDDKSVNRMGSPLYYGQTIVLRHELSLQCIAVQKMVSATYERGCSRIVLQDPTKRTSKSQTLFSVLPHFKFRAHGDPVRYDDVVLLFNSKSGKYLHVHKNLCGNISDAGWYEVNASSVASAWKLRCYSPLSSSPGKCLTSGKIVSLHHNEEDGYLAGSSDPKQGKLSCATVPTVSTVHIPFLHCLRGREDRSKYSNIGGSSSLALWQIENSDSHYGGELEYRQHVRIRHLLTGKYLQSVGGDSTQSALDDGMCEIELATTCTAKSSIFMIIPINAEEERQIPGGACLRIWHPLTKKWLTAVSDNCDADNDDRFIPCNTNSLESTHGRLILQVNQRPSDGFTVTMIPNEEMCNLNVLGSWVTCVRGFLRLLEGRGSASISSEFAATFCSSLGDMIRFCSISSEMDPLLREGTPIPENQNAMKEHGMFEYLFEILKSCFSAKRGNIRIVDIGSPTYSHIHSTCTLVYRLITHMTRLNPVNGLYVSPYLDFMLSHLGYNFGASSSLEVLFEKNMSMLELVTEDHVTFFIRMLKKVGQQARYIKFLASLCCADRIGFSRNQNYVLKHLIIENSMFLHVLKVGNDGEIYIRNSIEESRVTKKSFDTTPIDDGDQPGDHRTASPVLEMQQSRRPEKERWTRFVDYYRMESVPMQEYIQAQLQLYWSLCLSRNRLAAKVIEQLFPYALIAAGIRSDGIVSSVRVHFIALMQVLYVDCEPHIRPCLIEYSREWKLLQAGIQKLRGHEFTDVKAFILKYLNDHCSDNTEELLEALRLGACLADFGYYRDARETDALVSPLLSILNACNSIGSNLSEIKDADNQALISISNESPTIKHVSDAKDLPGNKSAASTTVRPSPSKSNVSLSGSSVYRSTATINEISMKRSLEIRLVACNIIERLWDIRLNKRLTTLLISVKDKVVAQEKADKSAIGATAVSKKASSASIGRAKLHMAASKAVTAFNYNLDSELFGEGTSDKSILSILVDLTTSGHVGLVTMALRLILRYFRSYRELGSAMDSIQILVSPSSCVTFHYVADKRWDLRRILSNPKLGGDDARCVFGILSSFVRHCFETTTDSTNRVNQNIFRHLGVQEDILFVLGTVNSRLQALDDIANNNQSRNDRRSSKNKISDLTANDLFCIEGTEKVDQRAVLRDILVLCDQFLQAFCFRNSQNQKSLIPFLDVLLGRLEYSTDTADTIVAIFNGNFDLCSSIDENVVRYFVHLIVRKGRFSCYLKFLQAIVVIGGRPYRRNQNMVMNMLLENYESTLLLYNTREAIEERNRLLAEGDHLTNIFSPLVYHRELLATMALCACGRNQVSEVMCQSLLSAEEILTQLIDSKLDFFIKHPLIDFLFEVYVSVEKRFTNLAALPKMYDFLDFVRVRLTDHFETESRDRSSTPLELDYLFGACIKVLGGFYSIFLVHDKLALNDYRELLNRICILLRQAIITGLIPSVHHHAIVEIVKHISPDLLDPTLTAAVAASTDVVEPDSGSTELIVDNTNKLKKESTAEADSVYGDDSFLTFTQAQIDASLDTFRTDFRRFISSQNEAIRGVNAFALISDGFLAAIFKHIRGSHLTGDPNLVCQVLTVFESILKGVDGENDAEMKRERQIRLARIGAAHTVVRLVCWNLDAVTNAAVLVGIQLLDGGNEDVQAVFYEVFQQPKNFKFVAIIAELFRKDLANLKETRRFNELKRKENRSGFVIDNVEEVTEANAPTDVGLILRFLQLLCEGHNTAFQNFLRNQGVIDTLFYQTRKPVDLVHEILSYLTGLVAYVEMSTTSTVIRALQTLTELCQGPCRANQDLLVSELARSGTSNPVNRLLVACVEQVDVSQWATLQGCVADFLISLLEGNSDSTSIQSLIATCELDTMTDLIRRSLSIDAVSTSEASSDCDEDVNEMSFSFLILLTILSENDPAGKVKKNLDACNIHEKYLQQLAHIEILRDGKLEKVYFRIPAVCKHLTKNSRKALMYSVNRDSVTQKLQGFLDHSRSMIFEMRYTHQVSQSPSYRLVKHAVYFHNISFGIAVGINLLLMIWFDYLTPCLDNQFDEILWLKLKIFFFPPVIEHSVLGTVLNVDSIIDTSQVPSSMSLLIAGLFELSCYLHVATTSLGFFCFITSELPVLLFQKLKQSQSDLSGSKAKEILASPWGRFLMAYHMSFDWSFLYNLFYLLCSIFGILYSPYFFVCHLSALLVRVRLLDGVIQSVTLNVTSLLLTGAMCLAFIYMYAVIGYLRFSDAFNVGDDGDEKRECETLTRCFIFTLYQGLRAGGGLADVLQPPNWEESTAWELFVRMFYDLTFFVVVVLITLNLVFGIILDTFAELRSAKSDIEDDMTSRCFVCNIESHEFDRLTTDGFTAHFLEDHNLWKYLFFIVYLQDKDKTEYTGQESYVWNLLEKGELSFFPVNMALCLETDAASQEDKIAVLTSRLAALEGATIDLNKKLDKVLSALEIDKET